MIETSRRTLLGAIAAAPVVTTFPTAGMMPSPLLDAVAASRAADARFNALPANLEESNPAIHSAEEDRMLEAYCRACDQTPVSWSEFVVLFDLMAVGGAFGLDDDKAALMLKHARRLSEEGR